MYKSRLGTMPLLALACALFALPASAESQVRIVRLSDVQGGVQIDKNTGLGFENAFLNLPITQGVQIRTRDNGRAEIEFEDGSTLRITPNTNVEFSVLGVNDAGNRISAVTVVQGRAYVKWLGSKTDKFTLNFGQERIELNQPAHFRVNASGDAAEVANFKNELEVVAPSGTVKVDRKKMVAFDDNDHPTEAKNFQNDSYDEWDQQAASYHDQYAKKDNTPYGYGYSDLSYYGSFSNWPGYGMMWQPYLMNAGWNPFMDGAWSWYPGMGYMWASAYPWGWMPYYYGNWVYAPGMGWGWQPGGWSTWHGGLHYVGAAATFHAPLAPKGTVNTVAVGRGGAVLTSTPFPTVLRGGSAGIGVARGSVDNLRHLNSQVAKSGFVEMHAAPQFAASSPRTTGFGFGGERGQPISAAASRGAAPSAGGHAAAGGGGHH
ncbi:MAG TPA: DUF6600 domain-containing protein [Candidatus Sulfotelmatobacter sp.]